MLVERPKRRPKKAGDRGGEGAFKKTVSCAWYREEKIRHMQQCDGLTVGMEDTGMRIRKKQDWGELSKLQVA